VGVPHAPSPQPPPICHSHCISELLHIIAISKKLAEITTFAVHFLHNIREINEIIKNIKSLNMFHMYIFKLESSPPMSNKVKRRHSDYSEHCLRIFKTQYYTEY